MSYDAEVLADAPLSYWKLDETSGTVAVDAMGAHDGTYVGGPTLGADGARFSGTTQRMEAGDNFAFVGASPFSFEMWLTLPAGTTNQLKTGSPELLGKSPYVPNHKGWRLLIEDINSDPGLIPGFLFGTDELQVQDMLMPFSAESHLVGTWDGTTRRLFLNAVNPVSAIDTPSGPPAAAGSDPFTLFNPLGDVGTFKFRRLAIYDHALSPERIAAHYAAGIAVDAPPAKPDRWPARTHLAPRSKADLERTVCGKTDGLESTICRWSP